MENSSNIDIHLREVLPSSSRLNDEKNVNKLLSDLITHINMLINDTASSMELTSHGQNVPHSGNLLRRLFPTNLP